MSAGIDAAFADGWVTIDGRRTRAAYKAQSPDGCLFLMKYSGERASSIRWFDLTEVELTRPVTPVLREPSEQSRKRWRRAFVGTEEDGGRAG